jgi:uncharacterized protein
MDQQTAHTFLHATHWVRTTLAVAFGTLALFLLVATMYVFKQYRFVGAGTTASNVITVTGSGEVTAVPDTAHFSASISEDAKTVKAAQDAAAVKNNAVIDFLKKNGVDAKDIKSDYSMNPKYEWKQEVCRGGYCPGGTNTLTGYTVMHTVMVKVRDTEKAGELLSGVGALGVTSVSGVDFKIDDEDALQAQARKEAIDDARAKAEQLAKDLGVSVVRIVGFNENGSGYPAPMYSVRSEMAMDMKAGNAVAAQIEPGQNKIQSSVSISYEIQ